MSEIEDTNTEYGSNSSNSGLQTEKRPSDSNDVWSTLHKAAEDILSDLKNGKELSISERKIMRYLMLGGKVADGSETKKCFK